jgi:hypothetical protein
MISWRQAAQRRRGTPMLRQVIGLLDKRSESPWESVMRVLHRAADIPVEPQREILDQWGRFVARGDLWIVGTKTDYMNLTAANTASLRSRAGI